MALNSSINTASLGSGFVYSNGLGALSANAGILITKFTSSGTWTKDSRTNSITIISWNAGGGGGSGRQGATTSSGGGGGGSGGSFLVYSGLATFFNSTETITIAGNAAGGLTQGSSLTNGNVGTNGGVSSIGNIYVANTTNGTGNRGAGGNSSGGTGGTSQINYMTNSFPLASIPAITGGNGGNITGNTPTTNIWASASGGIINNMFYNTPGGGGSGADAVTPRQAGSGAPAASICNTTGDATTINAGGTGGIETGTINGSNGNGSINNTGGRYIGATGGGGGGGQNVGIIAGLGGDGGACGAGGGGGGGSLSGTTSGAGGAGGRGELWVIELF